jgi:hypothetical protein
MPIKSGASARLLFAGAKKKLDLRGSVLVSDQRRLPQIIRQVFRSGPLPKAALSGFARWPAGPYEIHISRSPMSANPSRCFLPVFQTFMITHF